MSDRAAYVEEIPVWLEVNGMRSATWTASPDRLDALAAGRLLAEGYIRTRADLLDLDIIQTTPESAGIRVRIPEEMVRAGIELRGIRGEGDGAPWRHRADILARSAVQAALPSVEMCAELFRALFARADEAGGSAGLHSAALTDGSVLLHQIEEIGRHNAVDKAIGSAVLATISLEGLGLVLSARVSGEIAWKAGRAGLSWIASRSIPTSLAIEISEVARIPIIARAMGKDRVVHAPHDAPGSHNG
jgi:FdhD protein